MRVAAMHGPFRIPALIERVDMLGRSTPVSPSVPALRERSSVFAGEGRERQVRRG